MLLLHQPTLRAHIAWVTLGYRFARNLEPSLSTIHASAERSRTLRSRVTNGKELLAKRRGPNRRRAPLSRFVPVARRRLGRDVWLDRSAAVARAPGRAAMIVQSEKLQGRGVARRNSRLRTAHPAGQRGDADSVAARGQTPASWRTRRRQPQRFRPSPRHGKR